MRTGFVTCVRLGLDCLEAVYRSGGQIDLAVTLEDDLATNKSGRVYLDETANLHGIPLIKCTNINDQATVEAIREANLDWLFIIGWSQIAGLDVLGSVRSGVLGMHPTLLPEGRGRASVPWAILKGIDTTGVTMFALDEGVDSGPIVAQEVVPVSERETATSLYDKITEAHVRLMEGAWPMVAAGTVTLTPQDSSRATYWPGRRPEDGLINAPALTVAEVDRTVRALTRPYPGAFVHLPSGEALTIWSGTPYCDSSGHPLHLACADGTYCVTESSLTAASEGHRRAQ